MTKKIVYIDMDGTLVDFIGHFDAIVQSGGQVSDPLDADLEVFANAKPMAGAISAVDVLTQHYDLHILTTSPWDNPAAPSQKLAWIKQHFGDSPGTAFYKKVTISHNKHLNVGDYLIDDNLHPNFTGTQLHFGMHKDGTAKDFPDWQSVVDFLLGEIGLPSVKLLGD
jgi:5'-nucleotidase